jgi:hypothetical protein
MGQDRRMFGRWTVVAALVLASAVACTDADRNAGQSPTTLTSLATTTVGAVSVWGTADVPSGGSIAVSPVDGHVTVGYSVSVRPGPAVVSFGPLSVPPECIARAVLSVSLSAPPSTRPVAAYPADPRYGALAAGDWIDGWALLLDNRPRGDFAFSGPEGEADVTELAATWLEGGPFPSQGKVVPVGSPLVLSIQPRDLTSPATFDLLTSTPPQLTVSRRC